MTLRNYVVITPEDDAYELLSASEAEGVALDLVNFYGGRPIFVAKVKRIIEDVKVSRPINEDDLVDL